MFIKSKAAMTFGRACARDIPQLSKMLDAEGMEVWVRATITYPGLRSDLDASIIFDQMQGRIFFNDSCITKMSISRGYEGPPRADVEVFARPWLVRGKIPKTVVNEPLRRRLRAEKLAAKAATTPHRKSRKPARGTKASRL